MVVDVAVGIILKCDKVFLAVRSSEQHQGGLWEFPGGKCEQGESPKDALTRELIEEVDIAPTNIIAFESVQHDYSDKKVHLHFFLVIEFEGEPRGAEGQVTKWVPLCDLRDYVFPAANIAIVEKLMALYLIE